MFTLVNWFPFLSYSIPGKSTTATMVDVLPSWPVTPFPLSVSHLFTQPSSDLVLSTLASVSAIQMLGFCSTLTEFGIPLSLAIRDTSVSLLVMEVSPSFASFLAFSFLYHSNTLSAFLGSSKQVSALCPFLPHVLQLPSNFFPLLSLSPLDLHSNALCPFLPHL